MTLTAYTTQLAYNVAAFLPHGTYIVWATQYTQANGELTTTLAGVGDSGEQRAKTDLLMLRQNRGIEGRIVRRTVRVTDWSQ